MHNGEKVKEEVCNYIHDRRINDRSLRCVLEHRPEMKPVYRMGSRGKAYLEKMLDETITTEGQACNLKRENIKVEWGPPVRIYYHAIGNPVPECVCLWEPNTGWKIFSEVIRNFLPDFIPGDFVRACS